MPPAYALITGASGGIGGALAERLAGQGYGLILTGRREAELAALRTRLLRLGILVEIFTADLASDGASRILHTVAERGWRVELLVNNAGLGSCGEFRELDAARAAEIAQVNVVAAVELARGCVPGMVSRGRGAVINVASTAAFQAVPYLAVYAASKAFLLHFSLALHAELRPHGVHVMALCPEPTETGFFAVAGARPRPPLQSPETVAELALQGLQQRRALVVCGTANRVAAAVASRLPAVWGARLAARSVRAWQRLP